MAALQSNVGVSSTLELKAIKGGQHAPLSWKVSNWLKYRWRGDLAVGISLCAAKLTGNPVLIGTLRLKKISKDGTVVDYGVVSRRVVTTAGVNYIVDAFQNSVELENMKYHGFGTGTTAAVVGDTALETEFTTQYATDSTRPTGTTTEGASANIYESVATFSPDSGGTLAVTEHGILSQAATGGGVLLDRHVFSAVNTVAGSDSIQATYDATFAAGG